MARRLIHPLGRATGKGTAYTAYATVMLGAIVGLWALAAREYDSRLDRLEDELTGVTANVATLVGSCIEHVDTLRRTAEAMLAEPSAPDSARRLYASLKPSDAFAGYALDAVPPDLQPDAFANLTGWGALPPIDSGIGREIQVGLALNTLFAATHSQVPDAAWVYYTSKNHFMALHPWVPSREFHWSEDLPSYDFYRLGLPEQDPTRATFWTDVYLDRAGKGLMASIGAPVYDADGRFRGTVDLDLTLGTMSRILAGGNFGPGRALLVNSGNHVIADSATPAGSPQSLIDLADVLPKGGALRGFALGPDGSRNRLQRAGGWLLYTAVVKGAPWRMLLVVDRSWLFGAALASVWIGFLGLALLAVALVAVEQRRRAAAALASNVVILQRMTLDLAGARDEAMKAADAKSMLLANVSHELRTPLNAIIGFSDLMRHRLYGPLGDARYEGYADDIHTSGELLLALINDLLDVTKLEAGRHELAESDCDLTGLVREAVGLVRMQAERGGVTLDVSLDPMLPPVYADERALRQIALNLLTNGVKFTPPGGKVRVETRLDGGGRPMLTVKDTGCGIPHDEMKQLFRPFARTTAAKHAGTPGTGLGLAIVKSLVELHQGTIEMDSRVGVGTTVTVILPAARVIAQRAEALA
ncbi:MAG TPA: ATP-binding protein [Candidatus Cybelea sp.]|nr:ATP-binding protein [Candidatus Cybelea sp.]